VHLGSSGAYIGVANEWNTRGLGCTFGCGAAGSRGGDPPEVWKCLAMKGIFEILVYSLNFLLLFACNNSVNYNENQNKDIVYIPDTSAIVKSLQNEFDSIPWQLFIFEDLGFNIIVPSNWDQCKIETKILCVVDSTSTDVLKANLVVSVYSNTNLQEFQHRKSNDYIPNEKWTQVENNKNPYLWANNTYTSYVTSREYGVEIYEIGLWRLTFEHRNRVIDITLVGLLKDIEKHDYMFKFITSRIQRI
jgi:hypothetical protein